MTEDLDQHDHAALLLCMDIARNDGDRCQQLDAMLQDRSWIEVAAFASSCVQSRALKLRPWESPPCSVSEDDPAERDLDAQAMLRRMLLAGVSRWHPDPLDALAKAETRKARRKK